MSGVSTGVRKRGTGVDIDMKPSTSRVDVLFVRVGETSCGQFELYYYIAKTVLPHYKRSPCQQCLGEVLVCGKISYVTMPKHTWETSATNVTVDSATTYHRSSQCASLKIR